MSRTTIADVAKVAGVSKATVSRVLSGNYEYMRPNTRTKVENAIEKLGYRPSSVARSLTSNRTNTAAILVSDVGNPFYADVIHGVEDVAFKGHYDVFLCNTNYDLDRGLAFIRSLVDKRVDGVMIMSSSMSDLWLAELSKNNVPAVVLDWEVKAAGANVSTIGFDYSAGIQTAVDHLIALGHQHLVHVSGPLQLQTARDRRNAFWSALAKHGIPIESAPVIEGDLQIAGGRQAIEKIMGLSPRPTAVFTANDMTAIGLIAAARAKGIEVPRDLSVIGLDDIWLAEQLDPPLTTVGIPGYELGQLTMQMLFDLLDASGERPATPVRRQIETSLVVRQSTAVVPE
ncbi:MAG: LacI family DNA-binding transcriptional regulator [Anaerolineae bacterium]|nr:LacI family DNA-binding transcriptional regulator [Anaerolineae bacterium]